MLQFVDAGGSGSSTSGWEALVLGAVPKAGSTQLRDNLVPELARAYRNYEGRAKGEENGEEPCTVQRERLVASAPNDRFLGALWVREPLRRFVSGAGEIMAAHCHSWMKWRDATRRDSRHVLAMPGFGQQTHCNLKVGINETLSWHEQTVAWPRLLNEMAHDVQAGYRDVHVLPQAKYVRTFPITEVVLLHLENATLEWEAFVTRAGLKMTPLRESTRHSHQVHLAPALSRRGWKALCEYYSSDFACLGYEKPRDCRDGVGDDGGR